MLHVNDPEIAGENAEMNPYMVKILFVCHGNICRSPMAEHIFKELAKRAGLSFRFEVSSAAISTEEIWMGRGNPMDYRAQRVLRAHGIPFEPGEARQITAEDFAENDLVILMDEGNRRGLKRLLGTCVDEAPAGKVRLLLGNTDVADPWFSGNFEKAYQDIEKGCRQLLEKI